MPDPDMPVNPPPLTSTWSNHPSSTFEIGASNVEGVRRAGELLGVSGRTIGRDRTRPPVRTSPIVERAETVPGLIDAADSTVPAGEARGTSLPPLEVSMVPECQECPTHGSLTLDQLDACGRLHRRIRVRTDVIRRLLEPETARDDVLEAVLDLLVDIRGATDALETLLHDARPGHAPA